MLVKRMLSVLIVIAGIGMALIAAARTLVLPATCPVAYDAVTGLDLEIDYASVRGKLGCDGALVASQELAPGLKRDVYRWRGDAWPFGEFSGTFYNGVLHGKDVRWLTVNFAWPAAPAT